MLSSTRKGRAVLIVDRRRRRRYRAGRGRPCRGIGENRKLLVFPARPANAEMARGKGVRLQRYKDGGFPTPRLHA